MSIESVSSRSNIERAIRVFRSGFPILVHDAASRENEVDIVYPARAVTPEAVKHMREDGGGLICVALAHEVAEEFDLPYFQDAVDHECVAEEDLPYDERSSFSLPVNHRETYTGITDNDRAKTIRALGEAALDPESTDFAWKFRSPGHVHLLKAAPNLLQDRQGHTELGISMALLASRAPAVVVCEMVDGRTHEAVLLGSAREYARTEGIPLITGRAIQFETDQRSLRPRPYVNGWVNHQK